LISSCGQVKNEKQPCKVDKKFRDRYEHYYSFMKENFKENKSVGSYMMRSIIFMEELTGVKSNVKHGDVTLYDAYEDYEEDMKKWDVWYSENKCNITGSFIDSFEKKVLKSTFWADGPAATTSSEK